MKRTSLAASAAVALVWASQASAQDKELTLCWAAWDPANALVELSKDFEAQSGTKMNFEFVPWPNFADRMLNELNSGGQLCDLMIGDSQWIGGAAENGWYVKLNDFFDKEEDERMRLYQRMLNEDPSITDEELEAAANAKWVASVLKASRSGTVRDCPTPS